ncbi:hypothetical protein UP09_03270 [Bradyrhizobium sp. LTSP885]|nr:hypothetical protein UP09_03270 [Bradyrhizobium sp. LTSP885]
MQTLNDWLAAASTYLAALLALFIEHSNEVVKVLGFVLLVARLVQEVPRAIIMIRKWIGV